MDDKLIADYRQDSLNINAEKETDEANGGEDNKSESLNYIFNVMLENPKVSSTLGHKKDFFSSIGLSNLSRSATQLIRRKSIKHINDPLHEIIIQWSKIKEPKSFKYKTFEKSFNKGLHHITESAQEEFSKPVLLLSDFYDAVYELSKKVFEWGLVKEALDILYLTCDMEARWIDSEICEVPTEYRGINKSIATALQYMAIGMLNGMCKVCADSPEWASLVLNEAITDSLIDHGPSLSKDKRVKNHAFVQYILDYQVYLLKNVSICDEESDSI